MNLASFFSLIKDSGLFYKSPNISESQKFIRQYLLFFWINSVSDFDNVRIIIMLFKIFIKQNSNYLF